MQFTDRLSMPYDSTKIICSVEENIVNILSTRVVYDGMLTNKGRPVYTYYHYGIDANIWERSIEEIKEHICNVLHQFEKRIGSLLIDIRKSSCCYHIGLEGVIASADYYTTRLLYDHKVILVSHSSCL